ncbi:MAG: hypothetical protein JKY48_12070 [Flavobacteriales bacterium]|nr:hypothetical protein [Flavobacteriales bacterium]
MKIFYLFIILLSLCWSCSSEVKPDLKSENTAKASEVLSDKHFRIKDSLEYKIIEVIEPFLNASIVERYLLYPKGTEEPQNIPATVKIAVPVDKVAINSTTHLGYINSIKQSNSIRAVTNLKLYYDSSFTERVNNDAVVSIGNRELNHEKLIKSEVDVLFSYAIDAASYKQVKQLRALNQKVILISEYMEQNPIVKSEWLKVFAAFYSEKEQKAADSICTQVEENYNRIKMHAMLYSFSPKVMIGLPWKGTWYVSGGESFQAKLIRDANANYIWHSYRQTGSVPLDIETAINNGLDADFWINPGIIQLKKDLAIKHQNFKDFKSFNSNRIFSNYFKSNEFGANDYWESAVVRPDLVLQDLVSIFHDQAPDSLTYYKVLE